MLYELIDGAHVPIARSDDGLFTMGYPIGAEAPLDG